MVGEGTGQEQEGSEQCYAQAHGQPSLRTTAKQIAERNMQIAEAQYGGVTPTMPLFAAGVAAAAAPLEAIA